MADVGDNGCPNKRTPAWLRRAAVRFVLIATIAILGLCEGANATDWERLPDGRVVIDIKGIRFALRASGSDLDSIHFNEASLQQGATLRDVLASPDRNRAIFDTSTDTDIGI